MDSHVVFSRFGYCLLLICAALQGCNSQSATDSNEEVFRTSLVHMIATPSDLDGRVVIVAGFLDYQEGLYLFLTENHARIDDTHSAVPVLEPSVDAPLANSSCLGSFVYVKAKIDRNAGGGVYVMTDVEHVVRYPPESPDFEFCWVAERELTPASQNYSALY